MMLNPVLSGTNVFKFKYLIIVIRGERIYSVCMHR